MRRLRLSPGMEHTRVPHGLDLEAVPGGGGWLWRQLLAARSRLSGAIDRSAQKIVLLRERPRLSVCISAVPMPDDSVRFASSCRAAAPRTQPGVAALPQAAQNTRQCSGVVSAIEQSGGCRSFGGSRAHIVRAVQSAQPLGGFFGVAASTYDSHRAALGAV